MASMVFLNRGVLLGAYVPTHYSRSVNGPNPSFPVFEVPALMQESILEAIKKATGRRLNKNKYENNSH